MMSVHILLTKTYFEFFLLTKTLFLRFMLMALTKYRCSITYKQTHTGFCFLQTTITILYIMYYFICKPLIIIYKTFASRPTLPSRLELPGDICFLECFKRSEMFLEHIFIIATSSCLLGFHWDTFSLFTVSKLFVTSVFQRIHIFPLPS